MSLKQKNRSIKTKVANFFDEKSGEYDSRFVCAPAWKIFFKKYFFNNIPPFRNVSVVDIGCGTGRNTASIIKYGAKVIGLDISKKMLKLAKKRLKAKARFIVGDAERLPFKNSIFSIVYMQGVLQYLPNPLNTIKEISRILKLNGLFFGFETHRSIFRPLYEKLSFLRRWSNPYHIAFSVAQLTTWFGRVGIDVSCRVAFLFPPELLNMIYKMNKELYLHLLALSEFSLTKIPYLSKFGGGVIISGIRV